MKPVITDFVGFTIERVPEIRDYRITQLAEGLEKRDIKRSSKSRSKRKPKEIKLNATATTAMASLDPETQAFLRAALKG